VSVETLRKAAEQIRVDVGNRYERGHMSIREATYNRSVADWLTVTAWWLEDEFPDDPDCPTDWSKSTGATAERVKAALAVARAYLGDQS
jgi:hypothetical protein